MTIIFLRIGRPIFLPLSIPEALLTAVGFYFLIQVFSPMLSLLAAFIALAVGCRGCLTPHKTSFGLDKLSDG
ncbi:MAG: hypothetical protein V2B20_03310 [Pseudomonadota bacterium]